MLILPTFYCSQKLLLLDGRKNTPGMENTLVLSAKATLVAWQSLHTTMKDIHTARDLYTECLSRYFILLKLKCFQE